MKRIQRLIEEESSVDRNLFFLQYLTEENVEGVMTERCIQHLCFNMMMNCDKARKCKKAANQYL